MIAPDKVQQVERLLVGGSLSQRRIARMVGVSRSVVGSIAAGTRPDYAAQERVRREAQSEPLGPVGRCLECGGKVHLPCRLCRVRRQKAEEREAARIALRKLRESALRQFLAGLRHRLERRDDPRRPPGRRLAG